MFVHISRTVGVLWHSSAVMVFGYRTVIFCTDSGVCKAFHIIADSHNKLIGYKSFAKQIHNQRIQHLLHDNTCFVIGVGFVQNLT